ncbi:hypothetical protein ACE1OE_16560 [Vibrio sp. E150_011]
MRTLYYVTRTYTDSTFSGGAIIREASVELLKRSGLDVVVVTVARSKQEEVFQPNFVALSHNGQLQKLRLIKQRIGVIDDYLQSWSENVVSFLSKKVTEKDIIFCATGGDLASLMVGHALKIQCQAKFVANFHDPVSYTYYHNNRLDKYTHISRERIFNKVISNADLIVTSCNSYKSYLESKLKIRVINSHFGYILPSESTCDFSNRKPTKIFQTFYGGVLGKYQGARMVEGFFNGYEGASLDVYGHSGSNLSNSKSVHVYESMPREQFLKKTVGQYDCGVVSLAYDYFGACVPSKVYEYINMAMPIIGFLPKGEARDIINDNNFGYAALPNANRDLSKKMDMWLNDQDQLNEINSSLLKSRHKWSMEQLILPLINEMNSI